MLISFRDVELLPYFDFEFKMAEKLKICWYDFYALWVQHSYQDGKIPKRRYVFFSLDINWKIKNKMSSHAALL